MRTDIRKGLTKLIVAFRISFVNTPQKTWTQNITMLLSVFVLACLLLLPSLSPLKTLKLVNNFHELRNVQRHHRAHVLRTYNFLRVIEQYSENATFLCGSDSNGIEYTSLNDTVMPRLTSDPANEFFG